jgi:hypothetical protein
MVLRLNRMLSVNNTHSVALCRLPDTSMSLRGELFALMHQSLTWS